MPGRRRGPLCSVLQQPVWVEYGRLWALLRCPAGRCLRADVRADDISCSDGDARTDNNTGPDRVANASTDDSGTHSDADENALCGADDRARGRAHCGAHERAYERAHGRADDGAAYG